MQPPGYPIQQERAERLRFPAGRQLFAAPVLKEAYNHEAYLHRVPVLNFFCIAKKGDVLVYYKNAHPVILN